MDRARGIAGFGVAWATAAPISFLKVYGGSESEDHLLGGAVRVVEGVPHLQSVEVAGFDVLDQSVDEVELGFGHLLLVLGFELEEPGQTRFVRKANGAAHLGQLEVEDLGTGPECLEGIVGSECGKKGQTRHELRVLLLRRPDEVGHPVDHLARALVGDLVDRPLRALSLAHGLAGDDQAVLLERLDDRVERAVVEPDALLLRTGAQGLRDFVGVHGPLVEGHQHGECKRVRSGATWHLSRILYSE